MVPSGPPGVAADGVAREPAGRVAVVGGRLRVGEDQRVAEPVGQRRPGRLVVVGELDQRAARPADGDALAVVAQPPRVLAEHHAVGRRAVARGEGLEVAHDDRAGAGLQQRVLGEGEGDAVGEGDAAEFDGLVADVEELDELVVVAVGGHGDLRGQGRLGRVVVELGDHEVAGGGGHRVDAEEGRGERAPLAGSAVEGARVEQGRFVQDDRLRDVVALGGIDLAAQDEVEADVGAGRGFVVDFGR